MRKTLLIGVMCLFLVSGVQAKEVSFTRDDRDRLIRLEVEVREGLKAVNQRIEGLERSVNQRIDGLERSVNQRIDGLQNLMYVVISAIFVQIAGVIGFVLWDRRTALAPAVRQAKELEEREERLEHSLRRYARIEPRLAEILKEEGLMQG